MKPEDDENQERAYYWSLSGHLPCTDPWCLCPARSGLWPGRQSLKLTVPMDGRGQRAGHSSMQPTDHKSGTPSLSSTLSATPVTFLTHAADHVTPCAHDAYIMAS